MYAGNSLGRFEVPTFVEHKQMDWVPMVHYYPEPPIQTRGALNPWELERKRAVYQAEEKAWKEIQLLQIKYAKLGRELDLAIISYNEQVRTINSRILEAGGKKGMPYLDIGIAIASQAGAPVIGWAYAAYKIIDMGIDIITQKAKKLKKDIANWMRDAEKTAQQIDRINQERAKIAERIQFLVQSTAGLISSIQAQVAQYTEQAERAFTQRVMIESSRAESHRALVYTAALMKKKVNTDAI